MQSLSRAAIRQGKRIGFVPTMGCLHDGHLALMRMARADCDVLVASIFVNQTQFGPGEDFAAYPRDLARDLALCETVPVDIVFAPPGEDVYAGDHSVWVEESDLSRGLCGASRPGHFRGVTTVVSKLFNIVQPDFAVFGRKDAQQARVIERMVRDLNFPVEVRLAPIVREPDGLAMSSRNRYLSDPERRQATCLCKALRWAERAYADGLRDIEAIRAGVRAMIQQSDLARVEYVEVLDWQTFGPPSPASTAVLVAVAARVGGTRLIDNTMLEPRRPPVAD